MDKQRPQLHLIDLRGTSILDQLRIEEALLRADERNWCLVNQGVSSTIVMGISAKPEELIDYSQLNDKPVPVLKRFSGGGTVFIDENCLMCTFICNSQDMNVPCFPKEVFTWSEKFYKPLFHDVDFALRENDYVIGSKKFGGNAQYMTRNRWLHHSSLLWDFKSENMRYLKMPQKTPEYRKNRNHEEFLCKLSHYYSTKEDIHERFKKRLGECFSFHEYDKHNLTEILERPHRKATVIIHEK